ncbi:hypothetical protein IMAU80128_02998 [Lactiplantibacillus plantarum]|nr:hypothetical protein [Lactiplantibacillus plantarum]
MVLTKEQIKDELKILNSAVNDNEKSIQDGVTVEFFLNIRKMDIVKSNNLDMLGQLWMNEHKLQW